MGCQDRIVWFDDSSRHLRSRVDCELQLGFLSVVNGQSFHQQRCESRSSSTSEGVEDQESLESSTLISQFPDSVQDQINDLFSNGVVSSSIVIGCILFSCDQLLRVEKLSVFSSSDLIDYSWFQVNIHCSGDVFSSSRLSEEGVERIISSSPQFCLKASVHLAGFRVPGSTVPNKHFPSGLQPDQHE